MRDCISSTNAMHSNYDERKEALRRKLLQEQNLTIKMAHFNTAIEKMKPSVTLSTVDKYKKWAEEFGSK